MADFGGISSPIRLTGLATGLDTDSLVKQLMQAERMPLDKLNQQKQLLEWKQEDYRDITNLLRGFKDSFFDVLKPDSNMTSASAFKKWNIDSNSTIVNATANSTAAPGSHTITVHQFATAATTASTSGISMNLTGFTTTAVDFTGGNNQFNVTLNGVTKTISLRTSSAYTDANDLVNNATDGIQKLVNDAFGTGKITVSESGGTLKFATNNGTVTVNDTPSNSALTDLGVMSGASNKINKYGSLENLSLITGLTFDAADKLTFNINGVDFAIDKTASLNDLMTEVNSSNAGVTMSYSELDDKISIVAKEKGSGNTIQINNTGGNFFGTGSAINLTGANINAGQDAIFDLDTTTNIVRNDNVFTVDGVTYTLSDNGSTLPQTATVTVTQDDDSIFNNIKSFIDKYNEIVDKLNTELSEKRERDFPPLTDEQKQSMKDDDIKRWEEKARSGLLRNDSILENMVNKMRRALSDAVAGIGDDLTKIGISTGEWYDKGKLTIDENKLREAIKTKPDLVQNLFSKKSSIDYSPDLTATDRQSRYDNEGLAQRINDILQDNIRITRNANGQKGILLEKAGIVGDLTEFDNLMDDEIKDKDKAISDLEARLSEKEDAYYRKFAALEKAMNMRNAQSAWLTQQLGGMQQ